MTAFYVTPTSRQEQQQLAGLFGKRNLGKKKKKYRKKIAAASAQLQTTTDAAVRAQLQANIAMWERKKAKATKEQHKKEKRRKVVKKVAVAGAVAFGAWKLAPKLLAAAKSVAPKVVGAAATQAAGGGVTPAAAPAPAFNAGQLLETAANVYAQTQAPTAMLPAQFAPPAPPPEFAPVYDDEGEGVEVDETAAPSFDWKAAAPVLLPVGLGLVFLLARGKR